MPPILALTLSLGLIAALLVAERRAHPEVSHAVWIPFLWMFFIGTRFPSEWLALGSGAASNADAYLEGSPVDQAVFLALYASAIFVLMQRRVAIGSIVAANIWVSAFLIYGLLSIAWSDYPWTAFKRFTKVVEHVVMALVVVTESSPARAMDVLFRRFLGASVVLSVLFIKYFPELGRGFSVWTGEAYNLGVTTDKNALGHLCLLGAAFYTSSLLFAPHRQVAPAGRLKLPIELGLLAAIAWLLAIADAKTALVCSSLGAASIVVLARTRLGRKPTAALAALVGFVALLVVLEWALGLSDLAIEALNRDPTLTDRTYVWEDVLAMPNNPLLGTGFESFWLGSRVELLWEKYWWRPNQAHNGYIETYINLGAVGLALLLSMMVSSLMKALAWLRASDPFGPIRFALLLGIAIFNYTDATFKAVHLLFFTFMLISISTVPARAFTGAQVHSPEPSPTEHPKPGFTGP